MYTTEVAIRCGIVDDFDEKTNERINLYTHARDADYHMRGIFHAQRELEVLPCHALYAVPRVASDKFRQMKHRKGLTSCACEL